MLCDLVTNAQPYTVSSLIYNYIILVNKKIFSEEWNEGEKKNRQYIYIVENIKFIYTSFDEFFLPVSQRVEMNYIFSDNVRILHLSPQRNCQTDWMNLLCWYIFIINAMRSCNERTTLHCVESYLYYII